MYTLVFHQEFREPRGARREYWEPVPVVFSAQLWAASWQLSSGWLKVPGPGSCGCLQALGILCSRDSDPIVVHMQEPDSLGILCAPS